MRYGLAKAQLPPATYETIPRERSDNDCERLCPVAAQEARREAYEQQKRMAFVPPRFKQRDFCEVWKETYGGRGLKP